MPLEYSWHWHTTKNQKNYDSDICSALKDGKYETRELSCGSTSRARQEILESDNLLHKQCFVDSLFKKDNWF